MVPGIWQGHAAGREYLHQLEGDEDEAGDEERQDDHTGDDREASQDRGWVDGGLGDGSEDGECLG